MTTGYVPLKPTASDTARAIARTRIRAGMAFLDEQVPDWWRGGRIVLGRTLDMGDGECCIWGQLARHDLEAWFGRLDRRLSHASYATVNRYLVQHGYIPEDQATHCPEAGSQWMVDHGFLLNLPDANHSTDDDGVSYGRLTDIGRIYIHSRRHAKS